MSSLSQPMTQPAPTEVKTAKENTPSLKFSGSDQFIRELRKRGDAYFERTGYSRRDCPQM